MTDLNSCVLTEKSALALFGTTDAVGHFLNQDNSPSAEKLGDKPMIVSAVAKNPPANSSIQFDILMPMRFLQLSFLDEFWVGGYLGTYVLLDENADLAAVSAKFDRVFAEKAAPELSKMDFDPQVKFGLQPLADIHLNAHLGGSGWHEGGTVGESRAAHSNLFLLVAAFVFGMAAVNFVNITVAASLSRAKEVAVRKLAGSSRFEVFRQFLSESMIVCTAAFGFGWLAAKAVLPEFEDLIGRKMELVFDARFLIGMGIVFVITASLSTLYPAFVLSAFRPMETLYNRNRSARASVFGKILIVGQFSLAMLLAVGTLVFWEQLRFIEKKDLGFAPSLVLRLNINGDVEYEPIKNALKNEVSRHACFEKIAFAGDFSAWSDGSEIIANGQKLRAAFECADENFVETMGIELVAGENLRPSVAPEIVVNETFVKNAGLQNPVGQLVQIDPNSDEKRPPHRIIGVVRDFHFESLRRPIQPLVIWQQPWHQGGIFVKIRPEQRQKAIETFEKIYRAAMPTASFEWHFYDDLLAREYARDRVFQKIVGAAAGLALVICALGMFSMAHFSAQRRAKEIGIRRTLGASVGAVLFLLSKNFLVLVAAAFLIAAPIAFFLMEKWLAGFAFRTKIGPEIFIASGFAAFVLAFLTVAFQAIKAALADPVKSLRSE